MAEKWTFTVFRALFLFEVDIQQRWYLIGETLPEVLLEERKSDCTKMQKYIVTGSIKGFLIIC